MTDLYNDDSYLSSNCKSNCKNKHKNYDEIREIPNFNNDIKTLSSAVSLFDYCHCQINTNLYTNLNTDLEFDPAYSMTNIINNEVTFFERDSATSFNFTKFDNIALKNIQDIDNIDEMINIHEIQDIHHSYEDKLSKIKNTKLFIIYKQPKQRCIHRHKSSLHKNQLKNLVKKDFMKCIKGPEKNVLGFGNFKFENLLKKKINFPYSELRKKIKKGKIRIFDDDLIVKKIINNFCKFVKLIMNFIQEDTMYNNDNVEFKIVEKNKNFCSKKDASLFLQNVKLENCFKTTFKDFTYTDFRSKNVEILLNMTFFKIFKNVFVNSKFFHNYLITSLGNKFGDDYLSYFLYFIKDMISEMEQTRY